MEISGGAYSIGAKGRPIAGTVGASQNETTTYAFHLCCLTSDDACGNGVPDWADANEQFVFNKRWKR